MTAAHELVGVKFPTEHGEGVVTGPVSWSGAYVAVQVGERETCRRISDLRRYSGPAGDVPRISELAAAPSAQAEHLEARHEAESHREGGTMTVEAPERPAAEKSPAKPKGLAALSKAKLRAKLLATPTIGDKAWAGLHGSPETPERAKGESREDYIRRVLA